MAGKIACEPWVFKFMGLCLVPKWKVYDIETSARSAMTRIWSSERHLNCKEQAQPMTENAKSFCQRQQKDAKGGVNVSELYKQERSGNEGNEDTSD